MTAQKYRKKPVEIEAMQWDATDARADELWEWTARPSEAIKNAVATQFAVLDEDDSYDIFGGRDLDGEDLEYEHDAVKQLIASGFTAILYVGKSGQWAHLRTGDWVIREADDSGFYPCAKDVFEATYTPVPEPDPDPVREARLRLDDARLKLRDAEQAHLETCRAAALGDAS